MPDILITDTLSLSELLWLLIIGYTLLRVRSEERDASADKAAANEQGRRTPTNQRIQAKRRVATKAHRQEQQRMITLAFLWILGLAGAFTPPPTTQPAAWFKALVTMGAIALAIWLAYGATKDREDRAWLIESLSHRSSTGGTQ